MLAFLISSLFAHQPTSQFIAMEINLNCFKQRSLAFALGLLLFAGRGAAQADIRVTYYNGAEQGYSIAASGKLYFENGNLMVAMNNAAAPVSIPVSIIRKITFSAAAGPLPLRMLAFAARNDKDQVTLNWKTENEVNTSHFVIERSVDGSNYESLGQVAALNNGTGGSYGFADGSPKTGTAFYRLKQVDADGKYVYSNVLTVKRTAANLLTLLPNPAGDYVKISGATTGRVNVKIYSTDGRLMIAGTYAPGEPISLGKLAAGLYVAFIENEPYKLVKQ